MASRAQYLLRIGGRLEGNANKQDVISLLGDIFDAPKSPMGKSGQTGSGNWPDGFVLQGYSVCQWTEAKDTVDNPWDKETMISFRAEVHHTQLGTLYANRAGMLKEVNWFYHYRDYDWHKDLTKKLKDVNDKLKKKYGNGLIERVWFRDWQWYCGNGGC
jgi:hypothetical protein